MGPEGIISSLGRANTASSIRQENAVRTTILPSIAQDLSKLNDMLYDQYDRLNAIADRAGLPLLLVEEPFNKTDMNTPEAPSSNPLQDITQQMDRLRQRISAVGDVATRLMELA